MNFTQELRLFVRHILHWVYALILFSAAFFFLGLKKAVFYGREYIFPWPSPQDSFSVQAFVAIKRDLLPPSVELVVTNPMSAFASQVMVSILLAFLVTMPYLIVRLVLYLKPALHPAEKKAVLLSVLPFMLLFFSGCAFSYFFLIPTTFEVLYPYAVAIEAMPFFSVDEFIAYIFGLMFAVGIMFLLPLFMMLLSFMGIIKPEFWRKKRWFALLFFLILSAIITPDGSGVTMVLLFLPLMALYVVGYMIANRLDNSKNEVEI